MTYPRYKLEARKDDTGKYPWHVDLLQQTRERGRWTQLLSGQNTTLAGAMQIVADRIRKYPTQYPGT